MRYLLDTNTCIRYLNGRSEQIRRHVEALSPRKIVVCAVVKAELFFGAMKSQFPERNLDKQQRFLSRFVSIPFDDRAAHEYGRIRAKLEQAGTPIGPNDLLIAAIAIAQSMTLVSHNTDELNRVEGLRLEDWEAIPKRN